MGGTALIQEGSEKGAESNTSSLMQDKIIRDSIIKAKEKYAGSKLGEARANKKIAREGVTFTCSVRCCEFAQEHPRGMLRNRPTQQCIHPEGTAPGALPQESCPQSLAQVMVLVLMAVRMVVSSPEC